MLAAPGGLASLKFRIKNRKPRKQKG